MFKVSECVLGPPHPHLLLGLLQALRRCCLDRPLLRGLCLGSQLRGLGLGLGLGLGFHRLRLRGLPVGVGRFTGQTKPSSTLIKFADS